MMQVLNYSVGNAAPRAGLLSGNHVFDAPRASVHELLEDLSLLKTEGNGIPLADVKLHAPLLYPGTIYCAGANYADHVAEMARAQNMPPPADPRTLGLKPWFFIKPPRACVVGPGARVARPRGSQKLDWEAELVAVIGRAARNVSVEDALKYVAGYTVANDLSARDLPDPQRLAIRLWVNGALKQDSNTRQRIYSVADQISHLSSIATLHPGDIILTGTPAGVGAGRNEFLQPGDHVEVEIEGLGRLENWIS